MGSSNPEAHVGSSAESRRQPERDWDRERSEKKHQTALDFIVESGRAKKPEQAEAYLEGLNSLKQRISGFLSDVVIEKRTAERRYGDYLVAYYKNSFDSDRKEVDDKIIQNSLPENVDKSDPHVWALMRRLESTSDSTQMTEEIRIQMTKGDAVSIPEQMSGIASDLRTYLTPEELDLLNAEYGFERQALMQNLRREANSMDNPKKPFAFVGWQALAESENEAA